MNYIKALIFFLSFFLFLGSPIFAQDTRVTDTEKKEQRELSASDQQDTGAGHDNEDMDGINSLISDEAFKIINAFFPDVGNSLHVFRGSYSLFPAPGWRSNQYSGFLFDSFKVGHNLWLSNSLHYSYYNTTRDKDFPERLQNFGDNVMLTGEWFQVGAGASSKSDAPFQSLKKVDINAWANFRVWNSGPHSIRIGAIYSYKGEIWGSLLPLPTLAYRYTRPDFMISVGIPAFLYWRPHKKISLFMTGMLPLVGTARLQFSLHRCVSLSFLWTIKKEFFYLGSYPFRGYHDLRYAEYSLKETLNFQDEKEESKKFVLASQRAGINLTFNFGYFAKIFIFSGLQYNTTYYLTDNVLKKKTNPDRISNSLIVEAGAQGFIFDTSITKAD